MLYIHAFQLNLVEGVNNDVVISSVVTAGHLFLQQPMHPSYQSLPGLNMNMNHVYGSPEAPQVSKPAKGENTVGDPLRLDVGSPELGVLRGNWRRL